MSLFMEEDFIALWCKYVLMFLTRNLDSKSVVKSMFFRSRFLDQLLFDSVYLDFRMKIHGHFIMICSCIHYLLTYNKSKFYVFFTRRYQNSSRNPVEKKQVVEVLGCNANPN